MGRAECARHGRRRNKRKNSIESVKWLYISLGVLGFLAPTVILYAVNFDRRVPGAIVDLGLLFYSVGLSIIFIPLGMGAGLALAVVVHVIWKLAVRTWLRR